MSNIIFLIFLIAVIVTAIINKTDCYTSFFNGAKDGVSTVFNMFLFLLTFLIALNLLNSSGIITFLIEKINFKYGGIVMQMIVRPISASSSLAIMLDIFDQYGVDSRVGVLSSFIHYGSDSSIYIVSFYLSALAIKDTKRAIIGGIVVNSLAFLISSIIVIVFF